LPDVSNPLAEPNCRWHVAPIEAAARRSQRRLSRIAKGLFDPLFKRAHAGIAKGGRFVSILASDRPMPIETSAPSLQPGMAERAIDTATDVSRTITEVSEGLKSAVDRLSDAIAASRRPGGALATVSAIIREAPLASLFVAFLLGVAVARRR
jgi:hypothetical protein